MSEYERWLILSSLTLRYDEHGGPRSPASAYVPREAALAARQAVLNREAAIAETVPLPATNDADLEQAPAAPKRTLSKLPNIKFSLGRRPASNPGKPREPLTAPPQIPASTEPTDAAAAKGPTPSQIDLPGLSTTAVPMASPLPIEDDRPPVRSASEARLPARGPPAAALAMTPAEPLAPVPRPLNEALLIERGRRRYGRTPSTSATGFPRSTVPSRTVTPEIGLAPASRSATASRPIVPAPSGASAVLAPPAGSKKTPRFKSIPTPLPGTPAAGLTAVENPLDGARVDKISELVAPTQQVGADGGDIPPASSDVPK